ncbi:MAG: hypothetical protein SH850_28280 [Planctomycetaceae bacterium]|nr:hypothetical protein [Planctomycetaceae bacterium]
MPQISLNDLDAAPSAAGQLVLSALDGAKAAAAAVATPDTILAPVDFKAAKNAIKSQFGGLEAVVAAAASLAATDSRDIADGAGLENIRGFGIGFRTSMGRLLPDIAVKVFVFRKLPSSKVSAAQRVPECFHGIPVDVEEVGIISALGTPFHGRYNRPVPCGVSCSNPTTGLAGTLGAVVDAMVPVTQNGPEQLERCILSNNHVFVRKNQGSFNDPIVQPGVPLDLTSPDRIIGRLVKWKTLIGSENLVDGALARTNDQRVKAAHVTYQVSPTLLTAALGQSVRKDGMNTGSTFGTIINTDVDLPISYAAMGLGTFTFLDQITIQSNDFQPFAILGDSGALLVTIGTRQPVGLVFAADGNSGNGFANPIAAVKSALGIVQFVAPA